MKKIAELISLKDRRALVSGGAGKIGMALCGALMELGANVCVLDLQKPICEQRCDVLNGQGYSGRAVSMAADLAMESETRQAVAASSEAMGGLDIVIHSAAFVGTTPFPGWAAPLDEQTVEAWDAAMRVNLTAAFTLVQTALPSLRMSGHGSIIFIASIYGMVGPDVRLYEGTHMHNPAGYAASKGGLIQLSRYFATVLAPNIRVNTIVAGGVWRNQPDVFHNRYIERTPLGRMAKEEDIKGAVAYLASDLSAYVTGTELKVDGGWTAW